MMHFITRLVLLATFMMCAGALIYLVGDGYFGFIESLGARWIGGGLAAVGFLLVFVPIFLVLTGGIKAEGEWD